MLHLSRLFSVAIALFALALPPNPARAQASTGPPCGVRTEVVDTLHKTFGERLVGYGLSHAGTVFEFYASRAGSWTLIVTDASGRSCLVATGQAWEAEKAADVWS